MQSIGVSYLILGNFLLLFIPQMPYPGVVRLGEQPPPRNRGRLIQRLIRSLGRILGKPSPHDERWHFTAFVRHEIQQISHPIALVREETPLVLEIPNEGGGIAYQRELRFHSQTRELEVSPRHFQYGVEVVYTQLEH